ncbi:hypothetical protein IGS59_12160 [Janthinobacterium sp. GW460P]|uniref:hypothetical protein n=1 Tax=unclassified Janthinobacterium TaxID=2610881 RepID=UPI0014827C5D|nr:MULTISPECIES: hypothetical protein [unclassified Janthinobacterium]MCC7703002.1 hypothetical protein [Janthinobacterium sp. GW460P]MCC7708509.1 hypothetical protein [Janthinobacterium sp. GW460W]
MHSPCGPSGNNSAGLIVSHKLVSLGLFPCIDSRRTGRRDKARGLPAGVTSL